MSFSLIKTLLSRTVLPPGSVCRILWGPMRGMRFKLSESTGFAAFYSGNEKANQLAYRKLVRPGDTVIDAGANWGVHTLLLARLTGTQGRVLAFEPHPQVCDELRENIALNELSQVSVHPCGLWNCDSVIPFVLGVSTKSSHIASRPEDADSNKKVDVPCRMLDNVLAGENLQSLRLVKIDVEGAEGRALEGAAQTIAKYRPHLVIELHTPEQDIMVAKLLTDWGYKLSRLEGPEIIHLDRSWPEKHGVWGTIHADPQ